jgi:hypothetical protein
MVAVQGYFKNNIFINESNIPIPDGQPVIVTILENTQPEVQRPEAQRRKSSISEFRAAVHADTEELSEDFEKTPAERAKIRELDFSEGADSVEIL